MDIRILEYYIAICDGNTFSQVAERNFITRQAVSQAIQKLENECGAVLLKRDRRGVMPTPEGECVYTHARTIVLAQQEMLDDLKSIQGKGKKVVYIGAAKMVYLAFDSDLLQKFENDNPSFTLSVREGVPDTLIKALDHRSLDIAVFTSDKPLPGYSSVVLKRQPIMCVGKKADFPEYEDKLPANALAGKRLVCVAENSWAFDAMKMYMQKGNVHCSFTFAHSADLMANVHRIQISHNEVFISNGCGFPFLRVPVDLRVMELQGWDDSEPPPHADVRAFYYQDRDSPGIQYAISALQKHLYAQPLGERILRK